MTEESRQVAGRYELVELVGSGAMGMVWRGEDKILGRVVAVKELLMPVNQGEDKVEEAKNRAMREARIAARLQHPNAISVFNVVEYEDRPWLIMEYLPSRSLSVKLHEDGPLTVDEVIPIAVQLAGVLTAAHRAGVVHRDVKPGNVLLGDDGTVKVTDFGISRAMGDVTLTATGEISGTPAFLAPEVARGEEGTFASDVFALGATLYMAVEGTPPFGTADNAIALLYRVSSGSITPPKQAGKLEPLLLKLLELKPADRPSMAEVVAELRLLDGGVTPVVTVPEPPTLPETAPPAPFRSPAAGVSGEGAGFGVAGAGAAAPGGSAVAGSDAGAAGGVGVVGGGAGSGSAASGAAASGSVASDAPAASDTAGTGAPGSGAAAGSPPSGRRRRGALFAGVGAVIVVVAVILTVVLTRNDKQQNPVAGAPSSAPAASVPASSPNSSSSPPPSSRPTSATSSADSSPEAMSSALRTYFSLIPGDLPQSWSMLSDGFRAQHKQSFDSYRSWWDRFSSVSANDVKVTGDRTVSAQITYHRANGGSTTEHHSYVMVQRNGAWLIDVEN
ncbi:hypothetical protein GCM10022222_30190 [Amycolatopsis ultiminotia]|uniref:non-specific serine/threonine protein kinase n=1 Tax=Amycolatopsis ultiminotia TaxID=543629 RepID=A0ABP6W404_9PSEU